jgi:hypothetical protein
MPSEAVQKAKPAEAIQAPYFATTANNITEKKKIEKIPDKFSRMLKIALKLALEKGYDFEGHIVDLSGNPILKSDIVLLLNYVLSPGKVLIGEAEFIHLLHKAKVDPELITNENVKLKLINLKSNNIDPVKEPEFIVTSSNRAEPIETETFDAITRVPKRTREQDEPENTSKRAKIKWEIPKSDYPKMVIRKMPPSKWVEPDEYDQWRGVTIDDDSDIESINENKDEDNSQSYNNQDFALTPSKLD